MEQNELDMSSLGYWQRTSRGLNNTRPMLVDAAKFVCGLFAKIEELEKEVSQLRNDLRLKDQSFRMFIDEINVDFTKRVSQHQMKWLQEDAPQNTKEQNGHIAQHSNGAKPEEIKPDCGNCLLAGDCTYYGFSSDSCGYVARV